MNENSTDLENAVLEYLSAVATHRALKRGLIEAEGVLRDAERSLESIYFDTTVASTGNILVEYPSDGPILIELGRGGRIYPKVVKVDSIVRV